MTALGRMVEDWEWEAIKSNNSDYDTFFWYAVRSTGIFCRPSCASRLPKKENVMIFQEAEQAVEAGYRPCKRCRPLGKPVSKEEWVEEIDHILKEYFQQSLTLKDLAFMAKGSESYLRHVYKSVTGKTPQERLRELRLEYSKEILINTNLSVQEVAEHSGGLHAAYFAKLFRKTYGVSPLEYRKKNKKM